MYHLKKEIIMKKLFLFLICFCFLAPSLRAQDSDCCANFDRDAIATELEFALQDIEGTECLDLSMQSPKLTTVSKNIAKLKNLKCLNVSYNRISTIDPDIAKLEKLECIDLSGNHYLKTLPNFLKNMSNLKVIKLEEMSLWSDAKKEQVKKDFPNITFIF